MIDESGANVALFQLDEQSGIPIWIQLRNRFMYLIDSGYYTNGDRLPTVRKLASDINVNYHTVNKVYLSLEHEGYISSKRGTGAFVKKVVDGDADKVTSADVILIESIRQCLELGLTLDDIDVHFGKALLHYREAKDVASD